ncbi:hypothetical protein CEXT_698711 [Caerostris extrusa]|uniref:Uncharacterized protein n=1 Tax=Caerostris extrusa TaxID=172846 RepID=A0AAV4MPM2_CAEEX|nr:hypothetical protein CEXT_698711 [Caerostris extrusa]
MIERNIVSECGMSLADHVTISPFPVHIPPLFAFYFIVVVLRTWQLPIVSPAALIHEWRPRCPGDGAIVCR